MDSINVTIIGIGILSSTIAAISLFFQLKSLKSGNKKERENEKNLNIKISLECIYDISLVPEILRVLYKEQCDDINLNEKYNKAVKSGKKLDNLLSNFFEVQIFQQDLFIVNNLFKYLTSLPKFYPGTDRQQIYDGINNAFKFSQITMNRLVINFLELAQNKFVTDLRDSNFYQIRSLSGLVHLLTVEILKSNNKSLLDSFLIFFKKFIDLISKEIELYISLYKKNDHKAIEKFIEEKNSCVALYFIDI